jgi:hypothetical protein
VSQIIKAGPNTAKYPSYPPQADEVKAWIAGTAAAKAAGETEKIYQGYIRGPFSSWLANYEASRAEEPAPAPPNGVNAQISDDGFSFTLVDSGVPSGPVGPYQRKVITPSTGSIKSAVPDFGGLFFGPVGVIVDQIDGTKWQRVA